MDISENNYIAMVHLGRRTRIAGRLLKGSLLILLTIFGAVYGLPLIRVGATTTNDRGNAIGTGSNAGYNGTVPIRQQGVDPVPNLSLPKTVMSSVNNLVGEGGVISTSSQNLTLYNSAISMRLLGTPSPHDLLLGDGGRTLSSYSFWGAQAWINSSWVYLVPSSNNFTLLGTNKTGTFLVRTMIVNMSGYSGLLKIFYSAMSGGTLKWDLDFVPATSGQYRLVHLWENISSYQMLSSSKQFRVILGGKNYTLTWNDVSASYSTIANETSGQFSLSINLGTLAKGTEIWVDPSLVSTSTSIYATAWSFQRKVIFEPRGGYYFVFYYNGLTESYRYSHDGLSWSNDQQMPSGWPAYVDNATSSLAVFSSGQQVWVATGDKATVTSILGRPSSSGSVFLRYSMGTITGRSISWLPTLIAVNTTRTAPSGYTITFGIRYVNLVATPNGVAFSYNWYARGVQQGWCASSSFVYSESGLVVAYGANQIISQCNSDLSGGAGYDSQQDRSVLVPYSTNGRVRVVYQFHIRARVELFSQWMDPGGAFGPLETVDGSFTADSDYLSATTDSNLGMNVLYANSNDNNITYAYRSTVGSAWTYTKNILLQGYAWPTMTVDYSTNALYVFGADTPNGQIMIRTRNSAGTWQAGLTSFPISGGPGPAYLGSNLASASTTNYTTISLVWTQGLGHFNVSFASIPIATVWSPYASPPDPWDGNGIAPYAEYFSNLGESVSPSSGMLTIRQTDLNVPGRGINLGFTRVYTEPYRFLGSVPYGYESYPWAPMGNGWQLHFPWMTGSPNATYIHLWDGEGYRIPTSFWSGPTSSYDNHEGENFHFSRFPDGSIALLTSTDLSYNFDSSHRLANITDSTGLNKILFSYTSNQISKITDTVGRAFILCYVNGLLHSINQTTTGNCTGGGSIRGVVFTYKNLELTNATDAAGRVTSYSYDSSQWLITRITYPTSWYDTYSYTTFISGTQASIYRVNWQRVNATTGTPIRSFKYTYTEGLGDVVSNSTVAVYDGGSSNAASYTSYAYSFGAVAWNISDANHNLVRGELQHFNPHGQVSSDTIIVYDRSGLNWPPGSYTDYYSYDLWGNQIYSRRTIFAHSAQPYDPPPWNHESFSSYYNNRLQPAFNAFQETFSSNQGTALDNSWSTINGTWLVGSGVYNGTGWRANQCCDSFQYSFMARADLGVSDISMRASVFIGRQIDPYSFGGLFPLVGVFAHNPSSIYKWSLVLYNPGGQGEMLELLDEEPTANAKNLMITTEAQSSCSISTGTWVTFSLTSHGLNAIGTASIPGQTCSVTGSFPSGTAGAGGTGFGLYSGAYSTLFENVTATTVSPLITGTSFTNSFFNNGGPSSNIHSAIAGSAQLQNGTGTAPIESYYSYYPWGGLNQTRTGHGFPTLTDDSYTPVSWTYWNLGGTSTYNAYAQPFSNGPSLAYMYQASFILDTTGSPSGPLYAEVWSNSNGPGIMLIQSNPVDASSISSTPASFTFSFPEPLNTLVGGASYYLVIDGASLSQSTSSYVSVQVDTSHQTRGNVWLRPNNSGWSLGYTQQATLTFSVLTQSWLSTARSYDSYGNLVKLIDATGNSTSYSYSSKYQNAYLTSRNQTVIPSGRRIVNSYGYNLNTGLTIWSQEPDGYGSGNFNTTYSYDILGRTTRIVYPTGDYIAYSYNDKLDYVDVTNENGTHAREVYDGLGRLSVSEKFLSSSAYNETLVYNWQNKVVSQTDQLGHLYTYQYDPLGRLTQTTEPNGNITQILYNDVRGWVRHIDENNLGPASWIFYTYDRSGRLIETDDPPTATSGVNSALYFYDEVGNLRRTCFVSSLFTCGQTGSQPTLYAYDGMNRPLKTQYPDGTSEQYTYDNNGNVLQKTDRKGVQAIISYDSLNRPYDVFYPGPGAELQYFYDNNGNVLSMTTSNSAVSYSYDYRNRVVQEKYSSTVSSTTSNYNANFTYRGETLSQISYPDGLKISYSYDALGRVTGAFKSGSSSNYATLNYYATDQIKSITYGNGLWANYTYDNLSRPLTVTLTQPGRRGTVMLLSLSYSYNTTGTIALVSGQVNGITLKEQYNYDPMQRLTNATLTNGSSQTVLSYQYDPLGNMLWQKQNSTLTSYTNNALNNELKSSSSGSTSTAYSYDANGELLTKNVTSGSTSHWTYTWDPTGNLIRVTNDAGVQGSYVYDVNGRLVGSKEGTATTFYTYMGTETLYQNVVGSSSIDYVFAGGTRIAKVSGSTLSYYHGDSLGSTRLVTSSSGSVVFADNYQPFGQDNGAPTGSETFKFTGKPVSLTTGLYYDYQRWYDPSTGRFISQDPLAGWRANPQSLNRYVYVQNLPTSLVDPSGMVECYADAEYCEGGGGRLVEADARSGANYQGCTDDPQMCEWCAENPFFFSCDYANFGAPEYDTYPTDSSPQTLDNPEPVRVPYNPLPTESDITVTTGAETTIPSITDTGGTNSLTSDAVPTADFFNNVEGFRGGSTTDNSGEIGFASPDSSYPGYPGGLEKTAYHTPSDLSRSEWVRDVKGIANNPSWTEPNTAARPGYLAYGYDSAGYRVRVVIIRIFGGIYTAFRDS